MDDYELELHHHGILGMKWGVRRYQNANGSLTAAGKKRYGTKANFEKVQAAKRAAQKANSKEAKARRKADARTAEEVAKYRAKAGLKSQSGDAKKSVKDMSDDELSRTINRIRMEQQYKDLSKEEVSKGKMFISEVLDKSGKNIATQLTTYVMGSTVNTLLKDVFDDDAIVNPKKGQKDK